MHDTNDQLKTTPMQGSWRFSSRDALACAALVLAGALLWLPGLGTRGLWSDGEARAGQVARRMMTRDDFVTMRLEVDEPRLTVSPDDPTQFDPDGEQVVYVPFQRRTVLWNMSDGPLRPELGYEQLITIHKPVLFYWLIAVPAKLIGMPINAFTLRCFSTIPAFLLLPLTYLLGCTLYDRRAGLIAAVALATCVRFYWLTRVCSMDMTLTFIITLAMACWYWGYRSPRRGTRIACFGVVYPLLAAASLMKSFAYMLLVALIVLVYMAGEHWLAHGGGFSAFARHVWSVMRRMHFFAGAVLYLVLVVPWFHLIGEATGGQYTSEMIWRHMVGRAGLVDYGKEFANTTSWWFYVPRLVTDMFPWMIMVPGALVHVFRTRCREIRPQALFPFCWFAVWLAFFSLVMDYRKAEYILPLFPAAMLLVGKLLADHLREGAADRVMNQAIKAGFATVAIGLAIAGTCVLALISPRVLDWLITGGDRGEPIFGTNRNDATAFEVVGAFMQTHTATAAGALLLLVLAMATAAVLAFRQRSGAAVGLLAGGSAAMMFVGTHIFMDRLIDPFRSQRRVAAAVEKLTSIAGIRTHLLLFGTEQHELAFHLPERFDAVPGVLPPHDNPPRETKPFYALRSRLAALTGKRLFVVMERVIWQQVEDQKAQRRRFNIELGSFDLPLREASIEIPDYEADRHRGALVILEHAPPPSGAPG